MEFEERGSGEKDKYKICFQMIELNYCGNWIKLTGETKMQGGVMLYLVFVLLFFFFLIIVRMGRRCAISFVPILFKCKLWFSGVRAHLH